MSIFVTWAWAPPLPECVFCHEPSESVTYRRPPKWYSVLPLVHLCAGCARDLEGS